jgi:mannose-6-phosphate isomerase-like protein (cupin superfamily)
MLERKTLFRSLKELTFDITNHGSGRKKVFLTNDDSDTNLTQFAYGELQPGENCERHLHPTMEECFYFISGSGKYIVGNETYEISSKFFLRVSAGTAHELSCTTETLKFVYFGISTDN